MDEKILKELWGQLVLADRIGSFEQKELVRQAHNRNLKVCIYSEPNHSLPHIHAYWKNEHKISVSIKTCDVLVGSIPSKYLKEIKNWINKYKVQLLDVWEQIQSGIKPELCWEKNA